MQQQLVRASDIRTLDYVRVTAVGSFEKCPRAWVDAVFHQLDGPPNKYALIGTAVHKVIESYLKGEFELIDFNTLHIPYLIANGVSPEECGNVHRYLLTLEPWRHAAMVVEDEFVIRVPGFVLPIMGHRDVVFNTDTGSIKITDHKTNRYYRDADWWKVQFQPLLYAYDARRRWPHAKNVWYEIGYVNLGATVHWLTTPEDDAFVESELARIWQRMEHHSEQQDFPEKFNEGCGYCWRREVCPTFQGELSSLKTSFLDSVADKPLTERYLWAQSVRKAAEKLEEELKQQIIEAVEKSGGALESDTHTVSMKRGELRRAKFRQTWNAIANFLVEHPELSERAWQMMEDVFSVKVTGIDQLCKAVPELEDAARGSIFTIQGSPSLSVKPKRVVSITTD